MSLMHRAVRTVARGRYRLVDDLLTTPRPDDAPSAHAPGTDPDRVLVFGNGPAVGWGVRSHDLALPGHLARRLSALTGRGADVDALADPGVTVATAHELAGSRSLRGYDAVVVVLGMSDALQLLPGHRWTAQLCALLSQLEQGTDPSCHLLVVGIQPPSSVQKFGASSGGATDHHADLLNGLTADLCAGRERVHFLLPPVPATGADRQGRSAPTPGATDRRQQVLRYGAWAADQAALLAPLIDRELERGATARQARHAPQDAAAQLSAVRALGLLDTPPEKRFDDIVERARVLLGGQGASFALIDEGRQWNKAVSGQMRVEQPVADSFCAHTVRDGQPLVVPDAWADPRFASHPSVRFYAGHPIETADGVRVGALCVTDVVPRSAESVDLVLLRELALQVQRELQDVAAGAPAV
jgi:hypothetical protein